MPLIEFHHGLAQPHALRRLCTALGTSALAMMVIIPGLITYEPTIVGAVHHLPLSDEIGTTHRKVIESTSTRPSGGTQGSVLWTLCIQNDTLFPGDSGVCEMNPRNNTGARGVAIDSANGDILISNQGSNSVNIIDGATLKEIGTVNVGSPLAGMTFDPANGLAYVADSPSDTVSAINPATGLVVATVQVGSNPLHLGYDPANGDVYVMNVKSANISVIAGTTNTVVATIPVGAGPESMAFVATEDQIYVTNGASDNLSVIDATSNTVIGSVPLGATTVIGIVYDPATGYLYAANDGANVPPEDTNLTIVNVSTERLVGYTRLGNQSDEPYGTAYDPVNGYIYTVNSGGPFEVFVTNPLTNVTGPNLPPLNGSPYEIAYDSLNGYLYVPGGDCGCVFVIGSGAPTASYNVTFSETGLPAGSVWSVSLNGTVQSSNSSEITFVANNGSFEYAIENVSGYVPSPAGGSIFINGSGASTRVNFGAAPPASYLLTFTESGLASPIEWNLTIEAQSHLVSGTTASFRLPNGTYNFTIGRVAGYSVIPKSGSIKIAGSAQSVAVLFTKSGGAGTTFLGLPGIEGYLVVGIVVAGAIGATFLVLRKNRSHRSPKRDE
jgi:YVTN family beta-propeller protein